MRFVQRDWLSSNLFVFFDGECDAREATVIDTGYHRHSAQTVALVAHLLAREGLGMDRLRRIVNTHLHSDHCGGNLALHQASGARVTVPASMLDSVRRWDNERLTFQDFRQHCERFPAHDGLAPGDSLVLGGLRWQAHGAPGHDPDSLVLHCPEARLLISADALWENGFGVIFPELTGASGFAEQAAVLELIATLPVALVAVTVGLRLASGSLDGAVKLWDVNAKGEQEGPAASKSSFSPDHACPSNSTCTLPLASRETRSRGASAPRSSRSAASHGRGETDS